LRSGSLTVNVATPSASIVTPVDVTSPSTTFEQPPSDVLDRDRPRVVVWLVDLMGRAVVPGVAALLGEADQRHGVQPSRRFCRHEVLLLIGGCVVRVFRLRMAGGRRKRGGLALRLRSGASAVTRR